MGNYRVDLSFVTSTKNTIQCYSMHFQCTQLVVHGQPEQKPSSQSVPEIGFSHMSLGLVVRANSVGHNYISDTQTLLCHVKAFRKGNNDK